MVDNQKLAGENELRGRDCHIATTTAKPRGGFGYMERRGGDSVEAIASTSASFRQSDRFFALAVLVTALLLVGLSASPAWAARIHKPKETFASANQPTFGHDEGLAVDQSNGDLLVIDAAAQTLSRWNPDGTAAAFSALGTNVIDAKKGAGNKVCAEEPSSCDLNPTNPGFSFGEAREVQVAVDNSGTATNGNIYVTADLHRIDVFASSGEFLGQLTKAGTTAFAESCGVAVGPGGAVYVGDFGPNSEGTQGTIHKFVPSGAFPVDTDNTANFPFQKACTVAAGAGPTAGSIFADQWSELKTSKLDASSGEIKYTVDSGPSIKTVSVDPATGYVYTANGTKVKAFDASGTAGPVEVEKAIEPGSTVEGIALYGANGNLYIARTAVSKIDVYAAVPLPESITGEASSVEETSAILNGTVDPEGEPLTECKFEWGKTTAPYEHTEPCAESPAEIGTAAHPVHLDLSSLESGVLYHFRLAAANANGIGPPGEDRAFATLHKPVIGAAWTAGVLFSEATVEARINPKYYETSFHVEYLTEADFEANGGSFGGPKTPSVAPFPDATLGQKDNTEHTVSVSIGGLAAGTTYHWRLVATNKDGSEQSPVRIFATYALPSLETDCPNQALRGGSSAFLPDCRAYEMVSPVDKNGGNIVNEGNGLREHDAYIQSSPDGEGITYSAAPAFGDEPSSKHFNQYLATRHEGEGWSNQGINAPLARQLVGGNNVFREVGAFSPGLCSEWFADYNVVPLTEDGQEGYVNLYRRQNCEPGAGGFEALTNVTPPEGTPQAYVGEESTNQSIQGFSADLGQVFFTARTALSPGAVPPPYKEAQIYDLSGGVLHLVSVLPSGVADEAETGTADELGGGGLVSGNLAHAVSADGLRVFWSAGIGNNGKGAIYLRENPDQAESTGKDGEGNCVRESGRACTIAVSAGSAATFWDAAADGSAALYSEGNLEEGEATLDSFDVASGTRTPVATGLKGVVGASEDLSRIYIVSIEALTPGQRNNAGDEAIVGQPNLYLVQGGAFTFIATLLPGDVFRETGEGSRSYSLTSRNPHFRAVRVTPDGRHLAFQSRAQITHFDNADAATGKADVEVFVYEAGAAVDCVSCNPSGARPKGQQLAQAYTYPRNSEPTGVWAAAWIPGWEHPLHGSNLLSENGRRVFFHSFDALVPGDTNGAQDVYEWEAAGEGRCSAASPAYSARNGGCVSLISSGESPEESEFWDASADGHDVFFTTSSSLLPQDPGLVDLYDARIEGGLAQPSEAAACEGEACQSPPGPPAHPTPATAVPAGDGNVRSGGTKPHCPKGKRKVHRHGKARCVKKQPPKHGKQSHKQHKRSSHNRRAAR